MRESNSRPRITKPMFYHLTNRAKIWWRPRKSNPSRHSPCKGEPQPTAAPKITYYLSHYTPYVRERFGSTGWDRTNDQVINSHLHYRCATVE